MMVKGCYKDIVGKRFGRLVALEAVGRKGHESYWMCQCDCGTQIKVRLSELNSKSRGIKSCGCLVNEFTDRRLKAQGLSATALYRVWQGMRERCYGKYSNRLSRYDLRGIVMCDEWKDSFSSFRDWALTNGYREDKRCRLYRLDTSKGYSPSNCRFIYTRSS